MEFASVRIALKTWVLTGLALSAWPSCTPSPTDSLRESQGPSPRLPAATETSSAATGGAATPSASADPSPTLGEWPGDPQGSRARVRAPEEVPALAFATHVVELDIELSRETTPQARPPCERLDLARIARLLPQVHTLRLRGCIGQARALRGFAPNLRHLELVDVTVDDERLRDLASLHRLQSLTLSRVKAPRTIDLAALGRPWPDLVELELSDLGRTSSLARLLRLAPMLRHLVVQGAWASPTLLDDLQIARGLETLTLAETSIGAIFLQRLQPLRALRSLSLAHPRQPDAVFRALRGLALNEVICECPELSEAGAAGLEALTSIQRMEWIHTPLAPAHLKALATLPRLEALRFRAVDVPAQAFVDLSAASSLRQLQWFGGSLIDPQAADLAGLQQVHDLTLHLENFGDAAAMHLRSLQQLRALNLAHTQVSDAGLAALVGLTHLQELHLNDTRITAGGLAALGNMHELHTLDLGETDLVDAGLAALKPLAHLHTLRLDHTLITDLGLTYLQAFEQLSQLNLAGTVVTAQGVKSLRLMAKLKVVDLRDTRVPGYEKPSDDDKPVRSAN